MKMNKYSLLRCVLMTLLFYSASQAEAVLPNDSVDTYANHTVTDSVYVQGRSTLTISDVSVTSGGHLVASSPDGIIVTGGLTVNFGGKLSLYERRLKCVFYTYDASGNIVIRKEKWQAR